MARTRAYRRHPRFTRRLEVTFSAGAHQLKGIVSNLSASGLFIRTNRGFAPGTLIDIQLVTPDNRLSSRKGVVRRTIKNPLLPGKNGMGVELTETDDTFMRFLGASLRDLGLSGGEEGPGARPFSTHEVVVCASCGIKNRVPREKRSLGARCGRCGRAIDSDTI